MPDIFFMVHWSMLSIEPIFVGLYLDILLKSVLVVAICSWVANKVSTKFHWSNTHLVWLLGFCCVTAITAYSAVSYLALGADYLGSNQAFITLILPEAGSRYSDISESVSENQNELLAALYICIAVLLISKFVFSLIRLARIEESAFYYQNQCYKQILLEDLKKSLGVHKKIKLGISGVLQSPISFGFASPTILLPQNAEHWDHSTLENVLIHELGHIKRRDWILSLSCSFLASLNWVNPAAWYVRNRLEVEAEYACDSLVVLSGKSCTEYASQLLILARSCIIKKPDFFPAQSMVEIGELTSRIQKILAFRGRARSSNPLLVIFAAASLSLVVPLIVTGRVIAIEDQSVVEEAVLVQAVDPGFPAQHSKRYAGRTAQFRFSIDKTGNVISASINPVLLSGNREFDLASIRALREFKFEPQKVRGEPTVSRNQFYMFRFPSEKTMQIGYFDG